MAYASTEQGSKDIQAIRELIFEEIKIATSCGKDSKMNFSEQEAAIRNISALISAGEFFIKS
ncbi:hypothetical protein FACS1894188_03640 [Clostridia bacterium]|nr:hypothetical protein FACS1894188_03640 [Clostridia bacterium]